MIAFNRLRRVVLRLSLGVGFATALGASAVLAAIANPTPFFPYAVTVEGITVRSATPLPDATRHYLETVDLAPRSDMPALEGHYTVYIADHGWRARLFFAASPGAGGVTYTWIAPQHAFLSGADFDAGLLTKDQRRIAPPRDLAYYLRHEANHLAMTQQLGIWDFLSLPNWVREGVADLAALGPPDRDTLASALGDGPVTLDHMIAFGAYPRARLLTDWVAQTQGVDGLLANTWTEDQAIDAFRAAYEGANRPHD